MCWSSVILIILNVMMPIKSNEIYLKERKDIIEGEEKQSLGGHLTLNPRELSVNEILLSNKQKELDFAYENSAAFLPNHNFLTSKPLIEQSEVFEIIRKIPKGGLLHTHFTASVSVDFLINNITYRNNIYGCYINNLFKLRFLSSPEQDIRGSWKSLQQYRKENNDFDVTLRKLISLNDGHKYKYPEEIWRKFKNIFSTVYEMLCYKPVFEDYLYQILQELYDDNIIYSELRGTFMPLYELDGTIYTNEQFFKIFSQTVERFKTDHPNFQGAKYIHSIYRGVEPATLQDGLNELIRLKQQFPKLIAGFDFVGYEEEGKFLKDYHEELLNAQSHLKFFFHAGETNWYGNKDENLVDAVLLNTSRIGHGFALLKHPLVLDKARRQDIPIEICPISNQVLMLNQDIRNHPATFLVATGYPLVIGNDDPSAWDATGLSYDWYMFFMGMTSRSSGIAVLKQIAMNSIKYSTLDSVENAAAMRVWCKQWESFIDKILLRHKLNESQL